MKLVQKFKQGDIFQVVCLRKLHNLFKQTIFLPVAHAHSAEKPLCSASAIG